MPLEECIDLAVNYISEGNPDFKLSKLELSSLFTVATSQTHFLFNGSFYDQTDGVAMGFPMASVLTSIFMSTMKNCGCKIFKALKFYFIADMLMILFVYFTQNKMPLNFPTTSTLDTSTLGLLWKKKLITNYLFRCSS